MYVYIYTYIYIHIYIYICIYIYIIILSFFLFLSFRCGCLGKRPELCIGHMALLTEPPPQMAAMVHRFGAAGAVAGAAVGLVLSVWVAKRRRRSPTLV